jgi:glycosyltransferase involved in cell wall biosynthesis
VTSAQTHHPEEESRHRPGARLRICFIAYRGNMHCGGQGVYLWFLARELARLGHRVDVLVGPPYPDPMPFANRVTEMPNERFWGKWFLEDRRHFIPEPRPLRIFEPLNFYELAASYLGFHPLTVDRRASFARDQSLREAIGTMAFYPVAMQGFVARRLDGLFTSSAESARAIRRDFRIPSQRIRMVANGVDTELFQPSPGGERDANEILCVGRASDPNKGIANLIEALARLPHPLRLTLVDDDHPDSPARKLAQRLGCADRLHITGRIDSAELVRRYQRASLAVVPSRYEGFGLPAVEAMACGTPVVACAAGALTEVVAAAGGGVLVPPEEPDALAGAIADLMARPEIRGMLGKRGSVRVDRAYAWPRVARATAEAYAEIVEDFRLRRGRPASMTTSANPGNHRAMRSSATSAD